MFLFLFYQDEKISFKERKVSGRTIKELLSNKYIQQAITSAGIGYITMSFLMTATPISMHVMDGISLNMNQSSVYKLLDRSIEQNIFNSI